MAAALPVLGVIGAVAGTATSIAGQRQQARAAQQSAQYNAQVAQQNAAQARRSAQLEATESREAALRRAGTIRSRFAGAGVALEGSVLDVLNEEAARSELEAQKTLYAGELEATGRETEAALERSRASSIRRSSQLQGAQGLLSGISSIGQATGRL